MMRPDSDSHAAAIPRSLRGPSLRSYIFVLVALAVMAPLAVDIVLGDLMATSFFQSEFVARGNAVVRGIAESSASFLRAAEIFVDAVDSDELILRDHSPESLRAHLQEELALNPNFESLACIDARGVQVASFPPDPNADGLNFADRDYATPPVGRPLLSDAAISLSSGHPVVKIASRLRPRGLVTVGDLDLSRLSDFAAASAGPGWTISIVDQGGTVVADPDIRRVQQRVNIANELASGPSQQISPVSLGRLGSDYVFSESLPEFGWHVLAAYDRTAYLGPLNRALLLFVGSALAAILLIGAVALAMARRMLADFDALGRGVQAIRDRRYGEVNLEPTFDELRVLIAEVRGMEAAVEEREAQLTDMVRQRDTLLREVHHRVKNNMQIVSSLLSLQKASLKDEEAAAALTESSSRIQALALTHEILYRGEQFSRLDLGDYLRELCSYLFSAYDAPAVSFSLGGARITLDPDRAIPLGLIVTEIVSNSLKHAFRGGRTGTVTIELTEEGEDIHIRVADDGPGFAPAAENRTLGLLLVDTLVDQLQGTLLRSTEAGTAYDIRLKRVGPDGWNRSARRDD